MKSKKMWLFAIPVVILVVVGGFMLKQKTEENQRNREYEVSLVKALKNSYAGIEEIKMTNPHYTMPPGDWSCDIEMRFSDNKHIKYGVGYSIKYNEISDASLEWENRIDDRNYLNTHKGQTTSKIKVTYSDREEGMQ